MKANINLKKLLKKKKTFRLQEQFNKIVYKLLFEEFPFRRVLFDFAQITWMLRVRWSQSVKNDHKLNFMCADLFLFHFIWSIEKILNLKQSFIFIFSSLNLKFLAERKFKCKYSLKVFYINVWNFDVSVFIQAPECY